MTLVVSSQYRLTGICLKNRGGEIDDFVILKKLFRYKKLEEPKTDAMQVGSRTVPLLMVHQASRKCPSSALAPLNANCHFGFNWRIELLDLLSCSKRR